MMPIINKKIMDKVTIFINRLKKLDIILTLVGNFPWIYIDTINGKRVKETFGVDVKVTSSQPTYDTASSPKVTLSKQWTPKLGASASSTIESNPNNNVKLEYKMDQRVSVIGSWDGREALRDQQKKSTSNVLGLDLQYKMQFK